MQPDRGHDQLALSRYNLLSLFHLTIDRSRRYEPPHPIQRYECRASQSLSRRSRDTNAALHWLRWLVASAAAHQEVKRSIQIGVLRQLRRSRSRAERRYTAHALASFWGEGEWEDGEGREGRATSHVTSKVRPPRIESRVAGSMREGAVEIGSVTQLR